MSELKKVKTTTAAEICGKYEQAADVLPLLAEGMSPAAFLDTLIAERMLEEAGRFLAHALPKRESVWWACQCARSTLPEDGDPAAEGVLELAEAWVYKPTDENRRAAMEAAEGAGFDSPASWAAIAAFWSGDSLTPPDAPPVPPSDELTGTAVAAAATLAAVVGEPALMPDRYQRFLERGIDVANGGTGRASEPVS